MLGVGLIGYGYWGPKLARRIAPGAGCELRAICDLSAERLAVAAQSHACAKLFQDWKQPLSDPKIDAVVIATSASSHFDLAMAALVAGKHVLVEKPIALASAAVVAMNEEARRRNLVLMVDHTYVYSPAVRAIQEMLTQGSLGSLRAFNSLRSNVEGSRHDVDVLWDLAAHDLSILEFLFPASAQAVRVSEAAGPAGLPPSRAVLSVYLPRALVAGIRVDWAAGAKQRRIEIVGSRAKLLFDDLKETKLWRADRANGGVWDEPSAVALAEGEPLAAALEHFAACIRCKLPALTDGEAGLRVVKLLEAASRSLAEAGSLVPLNVKDVTRAVAVR